MGVVVLLIIEKAQFNLVQTLAKLIVVGYFVWGGSFLVLVCGVVDLFSFL
jgi:hypothetical protein